MTLRPTRISITWLLCSFALAFAGACDPAEDADDGGTDGGTEVVTDLSQGDITFECSDVSSAGLTFTETATFDLVNACQYSPEESGGLWISLRNTEQNDALDLMIQGFDGPGEYVADPGGPEDTVTSLSYYADDSVDDPSDEGYCDALSLANPACASEDQLTTPYCTIEVVDTDLIGLEIGVDGWVSFAVTCEKLFQTCTDHAQETTVVDPPDHRVEYVIAGCVNH
jgi:hypothetical protein